MTLYGGLIRLYPRAFREEYGEDMAELLRLQLREGNAARVWGRTLLDLAFTVPSTHLEAHMARSPSAPVLYGTAAVTSLVLAAVAGSAAGISVVGLAGTLLFGSLGVLAWRRARSLGDTSFAAKHWWKFLCAGVVGLTVLVVLANVGGEADGEGAWMLFMGALLGSVVLMAVGVVLGVTRLAGSRRAA